MQTIHRDISAKLPESPPEAGVKLDSLVRAVHDSVARMLDPEAMRIVKQFEDRGLVNIEFLNAGDVSNLYVATAPPFGHKLAIKVPHPERTDQFLQTIKSAEQMSKIRMSSASTKSIPITA